MAQKDNAGSWVLFALLAALLLWLLARARGIGFLSESVSASITTIPAEVNTGYPQFDSRIRGTVPAGSPLVPLGNVRESATNFPADPAGASCPIGFQIWKDVQSGAYWCFPTIGDTRQLKGWLTL